MRLILNRSRWQDLGIGHEEATLTRKSSDPREDQGDRLLVYCGAVETDDDNHR